MFAVPGWNVSAAMATQIEPPKLKDPNKLGKKAEKRKRKREEQVNAENLEEQWEKSFGKKETSAQEGSEGARDVVEEEGGEKRGKKRKRGKAGGKKDKLEKESGNGTLKEDAHVLTAEQNGEQDHGAISIGKSSSIDGTSKHGKKEKKEKKKRKKDQDASQQTEISETTNVSLPTTAVNLLPDPKGLTALQKSMRSKLASARFRHLNESLYTKPSAESLSLFQEDPSMFDDYHRGFAQQVDVWPENPVDGYVSSILARGKARSKEGWKDKRRQQNKKENNGAVGHGEAESQADLHKSNESKPLPRNIKGHCTVADLGCGTASLSYRLQPHLKPLNLTLHSFDLSKPSGPSAPLVTIADISALPLPDNSVDIAIFCLALMGTNWLDFIDEAYRILRWRGELWVSEIKSRFGRVENKRVKNVPGKPPVNSVGSLRKKMDKMPGKNKMKGEAAGGVDDDGIAGSEDEADLAVNVDGAINTQPGTDVSAFVQVLRHRGFVLDALPERQGDAIDLSNKMFVKMHFVKAAHPSKGKNAKDDQKVGAGARPAGLKMGLKGKKFGVVVAGEDEAMSEERERGVLKPCLYKIR